MKTARLVSLLLLPVIAVPVCSYAGGNSGQGDHQDHLGHNAGQHKRAIKGLSEADIRELRRGGGWGLAKAAELNGLPGPAHLLELKQELALQPDQLVQIQALHRQMRAAAISLGKQLIARERALDQLIQSGNADSVRLKQALDDTAQARAALRFVHLSTHLKTPAMLTEAQIARYNELRGYAD